MVRNGWFAVCPLLGCSSIGADISLMPAYGCNKHLYRPDVCLDRIESVHDRTEGIEEVDIQPADHRA